jgi:hypothetical protein
VHGLAGRELRDRKQIYLDLVEHALCRSVSLFDELTRYTEPR